jgi:cytochrome c
VVLAEGGTVKPGGQFAAAVGLALVAGWASGQEPANRAGIEFFEQRVRPLLAEQCYRCHGNDRHENDLRLSSAAGIKRGGDRGPPVVAGSPDESTLIRAVRYADEDLKMPPRGKLAAEQIADLEKWVKLGAPLPTDAAPAVATAATKFDLTERRKHWSYQPIQTSTPPEVADAGWSRTPVDAFILHKL